MNYNIILLIAWNFGFLTLIPLLARLIILLILSKKLVPIRAVSSTNKVSAVVNSWFNQKMKTNPKRTQTNPIFPRPKPILSPKMRIFDNFRTTFLCKTNPIFSKIQIENKGLTAVSLVQHQKVWCCAKVVRGLP